MGLIGIDCNKKNKIKIKNNFQIHVKNILEKFNKGK